MSPDKLEEMTIENATAISSLTEIAKSTSNDVDKLVTHMDRILTISEQMKSLHKRVDKVENGITWLIRTGVVGLVGMICYLAIYFIKG